MIKFINSLLPKGYRNNKGFWGAVLKALPAVISAGSSIYSATKKNGGGEDPNQPQFAQSPTFPESDEARQMWWQKLKDFGGQPGYGAIAPNWADIWQTSQQRVRDYYSGTATQPGAFDKIRASAAKRNVSDSPALETELTKALVSQGGQLKDLAGQQSLAEAQFGEEGRQNWLQQLMGLSGMSPASKAYMPQQTGGIGDLIGGVGQSIGGAMQGNQQQDWLKNLYEKILGGGSEQGKYTYAGAGKFPAAPFN